MKRAGTVSGVVLFFLVSFLTLCAHTPSAQAATLGFSASTHYKQGDTITIPLVLSTAPGEVANAVSAKVTFPADILTLLSVSKEGSIITFWPSEPQISSGASSAQLEGVILNPGYSGTAGTVLVLSFRAKAAGTATLSLSDASVLANDGKGTTILSGLLKASVTIDSPAGSISNTPSVASLSTDSSASAAHITSNTYPDQGVWYKTREGVFSWTPPQGATSIRTLVDHSPDSTPTNESAVISQKKISVSQDGVFYFHLQFKTASGWGPVSHYRFQVDTAPPVSPDVRLAHPGASSDPRPILLFNTTDTLSGIDHYDVQVNNESSQTFSADSVQSNPYTPAWQSPGQKVVTVTAYDKAGNSVVSSTTLMIQTIDAPTVTEYPSQMDQGDLLRIRGTTYAGAIVTITLTDPQSVASSDTAITNSSGIFSMVWTHALPPGRYTFTASATDTRGGTSNQTKSYSILVKPSSIQVFGLSLTSLELISIMVLVFALCVAVGFLYVRGLPYWLGGKTTSITQQQCEVSFLEELRAERAILEKAAETRTLTPEEQEILSHIHMRIKTLKHTLAASAPSAT